MRSAYMAVGLNDAWSGRAHRERAKLALFMGDTATFASQLEAMTKRFNETRAPVLIQQCERLRTAAQTQAGLAHWIRAWLLRPRSRPPAARAGSSWVMANGQNDALLLAETRELACKPG